MRIVAITDIHSRQDYQKSVITALSSADLIVIAGDITNFGDGQEARAVIAGIEAINNKILALPGNCDQHSVNAVLESKGIALHKKTLRFNDIAFYGLGGSIQTPSGTPQEYTEEDLAETLKKFIRLKDCPRHIFVSHEPPYNTNTDKTMLGRHVGSKVIRTFLEGFQPNIALTGHIHEARGVDRIGQTLVINPGPFPAHYAEIMLADNITYHLH